MASIEKVRRLFEVSEVKKTQSLLIDQIHKNILTAYRDSVHEEDWDEEDDRFAEKTRAVMGRVLVRLMGDLEEIYAEMFTDEEVDELTEIFSRPIFVKIRNLLPQIVEIASNLANQYTAEEIEKAFPDEEF